MEKIIVNPENWTDSELEIKLLSNNKFKVYDMACSLVNKKVIEFDDFTSISYDCVIDSQVFFKVSQEINKSEFWIESEGKETSWTAENMGISRSDKNDPRIACAKLIANTF